MHSARFTRLLKAVLITFMICCLIAVAVVLLRPTEPQIDGKPLSYWLEQIEDGTLRAEVDSGWAWRQIPEPGPEQREAAKALKSMATNDYKFLLAMTYAKESDLHHSLRNLLGGQKAIPNPFKNPFVDVARSYLALEALETNLLPFLPQVEKRFLESKNSLDGMGWSRILSKMGAPGQAVLLEAISSSNSNQRISAIWIAGARPIKEVAFVAPLATNCLTHIDEGIREIAAWALSQIKLRPDLSVSALINAIDPPTPSPIRFWEPPIGIYLNAIAAFGADAKPAIPLLEKLVTSDDPAISSTAVEALRKIETAIAEKP